MNKDTKQRYLLTEESESINDTVYGTSIEMSGRQISHSWINLFDDTIEKLNQV